MALFVRGPALKSVRAVTLLAVAGVLAMPGLAKAQVYSQNGFILIPGLASFDISWVDYGSGNYYLADRTNKAIDRSVIEPGAPGTGAFHAYTANFVGVALNANGTVNNDQSGPNGVQTVQAVNTGSHQLEIWAGDGPQLNQGCPSFLAGKCSTVKVIEAQSGALTHVIPTGGAARADELCNDTKDNLVLIANDAEAGFSFGTPFISFISTETYKIVAQLQIPQTTGGIEQCQWDHDTGLFFLNIPQVNGAQGQVLVIPPPTGNPVKVLGSYVIPLAQCALPQGMAIGGPEGPPTKNELFGPWLVLGCNGVATGGFRNSVIIDKRTGANVAIAWGLGGADQVWANDTNFFVTGSSCTAATCLSGTSSQLGVVNFNPGNAQVISLTNLGLVLGGVSSHSVAADCNLGSDESSGQLFVPVAGGVQIFTSARPTGVPTRLCPTQ